MTAPAGDDLPAQRVDPVLLRRLLRYLRPYRGLVAASVVVLLAGALLALTGPVLTQRALDRAIPARDGALLFRYTLLFAGAMVLRFGIEYLQAVSTTRTAQLVMRDLRLEIFDRLQRLSLSYFDQNPVGRLMTRVTSDVETLNELFASGVASVFDDLFTLVAIMTLMIATDWRLAAAAFAVMPVLAIVVNLFRRRVRQAFRDIRARVARLNAYLQEHLSGIRVLQLFSRERAAGAGFARLNAEHAEAHLRSITLYALFFPVIEVLTSVALALLLVAGGARILGGTLTVGVLAAFLQLTRRFFEPLQDLSEKVNLFQSAMASSERVFRLLDTPVGVPEPASPTRLATPVRGEVAFEGVWFRYGPDGPWVLRDVSFTARPGETIALVGHTGAGKTTIINLLLRFYDPERGRITLDGVDIRELTFSDLRAPIGFVQQDLFLFAGDLYRNLGLAPEITEEEIRRAAARVGADRFIARLPDGYRHVLGERGRNLSVGERQLLSLARALALDPRILVLDEATSSVDAEAEALIQQGISELMTGRTSLVIAHRMSTILHAEMILVLHHGEIVERGRHAELLARGGLYQRLYRLQAADSLPLGRPAPTFEHSSLSGKPERP